MNPPDLSIENSLWQKGYKYIAGIDEVGRGSWAGPVVAAAVILPKNFYIPHIFGDSKMLKPKIRESLDKFIRAKAVSYCISEISVSEINKFKIGKASQMAFRKCLKDLKVRPDYILIDAFYIKRVNRKNQLAIKKGDEKSATIAAASIIAKVYRDTLMKKLSKKFNQYGFGKHKGYGTKAHQEAIKKHGFSRIHRTSYNLDYLFQ